MDWPTVLQYIAYFLAGVLGIYLIVRLGSHAWFTTKAGFFKSHPWLFLGVTKEQMARTASRQNVTTKSPQSANSKTND